MPIYSIQGPDGRTYSIEGPAGATREQVIQQIQAQLAQSSVPETPPTAPFTFRDVGIAGAQGALGAAKSIADVFGAENVVSSKLGEASKGLGEMYTPERRKEMEYYQRLEEEAAKSGKTTDEIAAALKGIKAAPLQTAAQAVGSLVPNLASLFIPVVGEAKGAALARGAYNMAVGIAEGTGAVKGSIYDAVKDELEKSGVPAEEAAARASKAQSYLGENMGMIAAGAGIGAVTGKFGAEELLSPAAKSIARKGAAVAGETVTEGTQAAQEKIAENLALQKQGFNVPTFQGVAGAATKEGIMGAIGAGVVAPISGRLPASQVPEAEQITDEQVPLLLEGKGAFVPVALPDGSVAMTREDLAKYEEEKFQKQYAPQPTDEALAKAAALEAERNAPPPPMPTEAGLSYGTATQEIELLKRQPRTPETTARIKELQQYKFQSAYEELNDRIARENRPISPELKALREQMERGDMTYEGQQRALNNILAEFYSSPKGFKGLEKAGAPKTEEDAEIESLQKEARTLATEYKKLTAAQKSTALRRDLKGKLDPQEVIGEIGAEKEFRYLAAPKGEKGKALADLVSDGILDNYLPTAMRHDSPTFDGQASEEYIKEKLRTGDFGLYVENETAYKKAQLLGELDARIKELQAPKQVQEEVSSLTDEERQAMREAGLRDTGVAPIEEVPVEEDYYPDQEEAQGISGALEQKEVRQVIPELAELGVTPDIVELYKKYDDAGKRPNIQRDYGVASRSDKANYTKAFSRLSSQLEKLKNPNLALYRLTNLYNDNVDNLYVSPSKAQGTNEERQPFVINKDPENERIEKELTGKNMLGVAQWAVDNAPNQFAKAIAQKVMNRLNGMAKRGIKMEFEIASGDRRPLKMRNARGLVEYDFGKPGEGKQPTFKMTLNGAAMLDNQDGYPPGTRYITILHELLHVATTGQINVLKGTDPLVKDLRDLFNQVVTHFNTEVRAGRITPFMDKMYSREINALTSPDELLAWGITDKDMQEFLSGIKVGEKTIMDKLVELIRKVLNITTSYLSALDQLVRTTESILDENVDVVGDKIVAQQYSFGVKPGDAPAQGTLFEQTLDTKTPEFRKWFGNSKVVDENGNPLVVYHGSTAKGITVFDTTRVTKRTAKGDLPGTYFTSDKAAAANFTREFGAKPGAPRGDITAAYLRIQNPLNITSAIKKYQKQGMTFGDAKRKALEALTPENDGVIFDGDKYNHSEYIVFKPNQIKSVLNERPTEAAGILEERFVSGAGKAIKKTIESAAQRMTSKRPEMQREAFEGVDENLVNKLNNIFFPTNETIVDRIDGMKDNFWKKLAQGVADQYRSIKDYTQEGYMLARMSKTIDGALEGLLFNGRVKLTDGALDIAPNTKGLIQAMEPVGKEVDRYQIWVALNRDAQLVRQGRVPSIDPEIVKQVNELSKGKIGDRSRLEVYEQVRKDMNALNRSVLDIAKAQGLINDEAYQIFANDINFIPFYRAMEDGDVQGAATASGLARQEFSKQLKGGQKPFADLMENTLRNWSHILSASMKNKAANVTIDAAMEMGAAYPNLKVGFEWRDGKVYSSKSGELVNNGKLKPEYTTQKAGMVKTMMDGKPAYFEVVDPLLLDSISSIGYMGPKSKFLDVAKDFKNMLQFGVTLSPAFKVRNLFRDSISAMAVSDMKLSPFANVVSGWKATSNDNPAHISALAGGAIFNFGSYYEGDQSRLIKRLLKQGVSPDSVLDTDEKIKKGLAQAWRKYQEWGNKSEAANRMALYQQMRDRGMSHLEASFYARDLLDFSMQGSWPAFRLVSQVVPFLNARVQGLYKLGRDGVIPTSRVLYNTVTGKPIELSDKQKAQQFSTVTGAVVLASMALYLMFKDDDEFQKREAWDRDNFWWFKLPGMDTALRVPKPFEIGAFGTLAERTLEQIIDQGAEGKQFEESLRRMLGDTFALNPTPQAIKPLLDLYANKDSFTGAPIETAGMERLSKQERASDATSPLAKALGGVSSVMATIFGEKTELSPVQIDYAIKSYFGWLGGTISTASHYAVMPFSKSAYPDHDWKETMSLGFVKSLPATQSRYVSEFYQNSRQISQAYADMRHYAELGQEDKVEEILAKNEDQIALAKAYDKAAKDMAKIRQVISAIRNDESMSGEEKKEEIDRLKLLIDEIAKQMETVRKDLRK